MRPADAIHAQIRWDPRLDERRFTIGLDEHTGTPKVLAFDRFVPNGDIPWHRVVFFAVDHRPVWDRRTGIDTVDALAETGSCDPDALDAPWKALSPVRWNGQQWKEAPTQPGRTVDEHLTVVTFNVLWNRHNPEKIYSSERWPLLLDEVLSLDADVVAFQEMDPAFHRLLLSDARVRDQWWVSHGPGHPQIGERDVLWLGRVAVRQVAMLRFDPHKGALAAVLDDERRTVVVTTHLSSDHRPNAAGHRATELTTLFAGLADRKGPIVLVGDFNLASAAPVGDTRDAWLELHPPAPTFEPPRNPLAAIGSRSGRSARLDRVLLLGDAHPRAIERIGLEPVRSRWLSDHYGLRAELELGVVGPRHEGKPTVRSALAWVLDDPPHSLVELRKHHDPAFRRWPPHINVLWGFVPESELSTATAVVAEVVRTIAPFPCVLSSTGHFGRGARTTHHLAPEEAENWRDLEAALGRAFPNMRRRPVFHPHLTVARCASVPPIAELLPIGSRVESLVWLTRRGSEPFEVRQRFTLSTGDVLEPAKTVHAVRVADDPTPTVDQIRAALPECEVTVIGSHRLGCALATSDLDLLVESPERPLEALRDALEAAGAEAQIVTKNGGVGLRLQLNGPVDLVVLHPDDQGPFALQARTAVADADHLGERLDEARMRLLRDVKAWAHLSLLDDAALGGLEGLAWGVLVAESPPSVQSLPAFIQHWAARDWEQAVGTDRPAEHPVDVCTPTEPVRTITTRAVRHLLEGALFGAWERVEQGKPVLVRPDWHRHHAHAVIVVCEDDAAVGAVRGRSRAVLQALEGAVPRWSRRTLAFGLHNTDAPDQAVHAVKSVLRGVRGVRVSGVPTEEVG